MLLSNHKIHSTSQTFASFISRQYLTQKFGYIDWGISLSHHQGLEMFIILIQLLLNVARHNASRFFYYLFITTITIQGKV